MKVKVKLQKSDPCKKIVAPGASLITPLPPAAVECRQKEQMKVRAKKCK